MKIEHVALYVNDLEAARVFFVTWLNCCIFRLSANGSAMRSRCWKRVWTDIRITRNG